MNLAVVDAPEQLFSSVCGPDGTYFLSAHDRQEQQSWLYRVRDPADETSYKQIHHFEKCPYQPKGIHITSDGTLLWAPGDCSIYRFETYSTAPEEVLGLDDGFYSWSFSENDSGEMLAGNYGLKPTVYLGENDGQTWNVIADESVLNFPNHVHKVAWSPHDNRIVVTGGDGINNIYRSLDSGDSWEEIVIPCQALGLTFHPTDPDVYFLGADANASWKFFIFQNLMHRSPHSVREFVKSSGIFSTRPYQPAPVPYSGYQGIYKVTDTTDSRSTKVEKVLDIDRELLGAFVIRTIRMDGKWRYLAGTGGGGARALQSFYLNEGPKGKQWSRIGTFKGSGAVCMTVSHGAYGRCYESEDVAYTVATADGNGNPGGKTGGYAKIISNSCSNPTSRMAKSEK